jgi:hypothetical protein
MMPGKHKANLRASITVEGEASDILCEAMKIRAGMRRVALTIELKKPGKLTHSEPYHLPAMMGSNVGAILESLGHLCEQGRVSQEDESKIRDLIRSFSLLF